MTFCVLHLSLTIIFSRFIHVAACVWIVLLFVAEWYSMVWPYHILFIHSSAVHWIVSFWSFWIVLLWTFRCKFLFEHLFSIFLDVYLGVKLQSNFMLNCLRNCQTVFHSSFTLFHSYWQSVTFPISPHSSQPFLLSGMFDYGHCSRCEVGSNCGFCLHFPKTNDTEHISQFLTVNLMGFLSSRNWFGTHREGRETDIKHSVWKGI